MKKIPLLLLFLIIAQISCRFLYFYNNHKIAPTEDAYYLIQNDFLNIKETPNNDYVWTKSSFLKEEMSLVFKRVPIGNIGECNYEGQYGAYKKTGHYEISDVELKKYSGLYYIVILIGIYMIFIFDFSLLRRKTNIDENL